MYPDIRDGTAGTNDVLAKLKSCGNSDGFDRRVDAALAGERHNLVCRFAVGAVDGLRRAELARDLKTIVVEVDHDDFRRGIELRRQQCCEPDRARADDCNRGSRRDLAVQHTAFKASRQDIAQHHQRLFVRTFWNRIKAGVGVRDTDIFGLGAVNLVAKNPTASRTMRVHAPTAVFAFAARRDTGDQYSVSRFERRHGGADLIDNAHAFVAENAAGLAGGNVTLEDVQIGAADGCLCNPDNCIRRRAQIRPDMILQRLFVRPSINESLHHSYLDDGNVSRFFQNRRCGHVCYLSEKRLSFMSPKLR